MNDTALPRRGRFFSAPLFRDRRFLLMLALGFSAGLPLPLAAGVVLRQWFAEIDMSLSAIGLTAFIGLAYANKFIWSPFFDAVRPPLLGRRRGWLVLLQLALMVAIAGIGLTNPAGGAEVTVALAVLVAFLSASQDIVIDAWRIEMLGEDDERQAYGLAAYVWGYRLALVASGAGTLFLVKYLGWSGAYACAAALMAVGIAATLAGREDDAAPAVALTWARRLRSTVIDPFLDFMERRYWFAILAFIALFKLGEALASLPLTVFYRSEGFTRDDVAAVGTVFGLAATLLGAVAGSWLIGRIGVGRALVLTGVTQMLSNLMYLALVGGGRDIAMLFAQVGVENFTDGLADAAFLTYLSGLVNRSFSATQYALLSSLAAIPARSLSALAGPLAQSLGWSQFFILTTLAALPAMAVMLFLLWRLPPPDRRASPEA